MGKTHLNLALVTLLSSAPVLATSAAYAQTTAPVVESAAALAEDPARVNAVGRAVPASPTVMDLQSPAPPTPMPLNVPDPVTTEEVQGEYWVGITALVLGAVFVAAIVLGGLYYITRRSWSTTH